MNRNLNGIVFDLEATCQDRNLEPNFDNECIEIGAVKVVGGVIVGEFSTFIKPKFTQVNKYCTDLTSIKGVDVKDAPSFVDAVELFKEFSGDLPLLSWGFYDKKQLEKDSARYGLDINWLLNHRSLKHEYAEIVKSRIVQMKEDGIEVPNWLRKKRSWGMESALKLEGLSLEGVHHRGIDDARNIARIYTKVFTK